MTCKEYNDFVGKVSRIRAKICEETDCGNCILKGSADFRNNPCYVSDAAFTEEQFNFVQNFVDWSEVPVDTKIVAWTDYVPKCKRHFAKYEDGKVYSFGRGKSSYTTDNEHNLEVWQYAELYKEET